MALIFSIGTALQTLNVLHGLKSLYLALSQRVALYLALSRTLCVLSPDEHASLSLGEHATSISSFVVVYVCVVCMAVAVLQLAL